MIPPQGNAQKKNLLDSEADSSHENIMCPISL